MLIDLIIKESLKSQKRLFLQEIQSLSLTPGIFSYEE